LGRGEEDFTTAPAAEALACRGILTNATISNVTTTYRYSLFIIQEDPFFTGKINVGSHHENPY
jgi:hypothetical protein